MTFEYPKAGVNAAVEYMVSGLPWVTSSNVSSSVAAQIDFPMVTSNITVRNKIQGTIKMYLWEEREV